MQRLDDGFRDEPLWVDPCDDAIWTEPKLGDGRFNEDDRKYRYVVLKRQQFIDAITIQGIASQPGGATYRTKDNGSNRVDNIAATSSVLHQQITRRYSEAKLEEWYRQTWIKDNQQKGKLPTRDEDWQAANPKCHPAFHVMRCDG